MLILEIPVRVDRTTFKSTFPSEAAESLGFAFDVVNPTPAFQEHEGKKIYWVQPIKEPIVLGEDDDE